MGEEGHLTQCIEAINDFIVENKTSFRLRLGGFDKGVFAVFNGDIPEEKETAIKRLKLIYPNRSADLADALRDTLVYLEKRKLTAKIIILSDGKLAAQDDIADLLKQLRNKDSFVNTVAIAKKDVQRLSRRPDQA